MMNGMKKAVMVMMATVVLCGCGEDAKVGERPRLAEADPIANEEPTGTTDQAEPGITVEIRNWGVGVDAAGNDAWYEHTDKEQYDDPQKGDVIYDSFGASLTVESVSDKKIVLANGGGLIEPNADGSINLMGKGPDTYTIKSGESLELHTQSMDAGATVIITFHT